MNQNDRNAILAFILTLTFLTGCSGPSNEQGTAQQEPQTPAESASQQAAEPQVSFDTEYYGFTDSALAAQKGPGTPNVVEMDGKPTVVSRSYSQTLLDIDTETTFMLDEQNRVHYITHTFHKPYAHVLPLIQKGLHRKGQIEEKTADGSEKVVWYAQGFHYSMNITNGDDCILSIIKIPSA